MVSTCVGGCLEVSPSDGKLQAGTSTWPYACAQTNGRPVYCRASDGKLITDPGHETAFEYVGLGSSVIRDGTTIACNGSPQLNVQTAVSRIGIANNSACRSMLVQVEAGARMRFDVLRAIFDQEVSGTVGQTLTLESRYRVNGGPFTTHQRTNYELDQTHFTAAGSSNSIPIQPFLLAPAATAVIDTQIVLTCDPNPSTVIEGLIIFNQAALSVVGRTI